MQLQWLGPELCWARWGAGQQGMIMIMAMVGADRATGRGGGCMGLVACCENMQRGRRAKDDRESVKCEAHTFKVCKYANKQHCGHDACWQMHN